MPPRGHHLKSKVPKEPKHAFGPFHHFLSDFRSEVKKSKTVVIEPKDVIKKCTERWHQMKDRDKMKYKIMSMADHRRAKYEWKIFNKRCKEENIEVKKPKRCRGALMWFIQEKRKDHKDKDTKLKWGEHLKILHQQFKDLSDEERRPYVEMEEKDRQRKKEEVKKIKQEKRKSKPKKVKKKGATLIPHERITSNEFISDSDSE